KATLAAASPPTSLACPARSGGSRSSCRPSRSPLGMACCAGTPGLAGLYSATSRYRPAIAGWRAMPECGLATLRLASRPTSPPPAMPGVAWVATSMVSSAFADCAPAGAGMAATRATAREPASADGRRTGECFMGAYLRGGSDGDPAGPGRLRAPHPRDSGPSTDRRCRARVPRSVQAGGQGQHLTGAGVGFAVDAQVRLDCFAHRLARPVRDVADEQFGAGGHDPRPLDAVVDAGAARFRDRLVVQRDGFVHAAG